MSYTTPPATPRPDAPPPVRVVGTDNRTDNQRADFHLAWFATLAMLSAQQEPNTLTLSPGQP